MGMFLNSDIPFEIYRAVSAEPYFVDKTDLIGELIPAIGSEQRFFCITRPRRFGKSVMANMVGAYFGKSADAGSIFDGLRIGKQSGYREHLNKHNVIFIDFSKMPRDCTKYTQYIDRIQDELNRELAESYPQCAIEISGTVWDNLLQVFRNTKDRFIFVMDEWDAIFHQSFINAGDKARFLAFLRDLLKSQPYVELAYMTGVLPVAKYSSGSELNMFLEYDMATKKKFSEYFGFLDDEVDRLFEIYLKRTAGSEMTRDELALWYDGYYTAKGEHLYNPRSVVCALTDNQLANYWTASGPYDEIFYYIRNDIAAIRDDLVLMIAGEGIKIKLQGYAATSAELGTKNQIYSAMVVYGLLTYREGKVFIPNKELMDKFDELLLSNESLGYVHRLAMESERMLAATLAGDTAAMAEILEYAHNTEIPILSYNSETELAAIVNLVYLAARDSYRVEREDKSGKGYVDFIFYPNRRGDDGIILELKVDHSPEEAIGQIKERQYATRFSGKLGDSQKLAGRILAVGIGYNKTTKVHDCRVEVISPIATADI